MPGYTGFIPGLKADDKFGKTFTNLSKDCFEKKNLGKNIYKLSSTGFNFRKHDFSETHQEAISHKFGKDTIPKLDPCLDVFILFFIEKVRDLNSFLRK